MPWPKGAAFIGIYGSPVVQFFVTIWVAFWVCRRQGTAVAWYGLFIGVVSGLAAAVQVAFFSGVPRQILLDATLLTFLPVPMFAGWLGARRSQVALAGQERLYLASQAIGHAHTPQDHRQRHREKSGGGQREPNWPVGNFATRARGVALRPFLFSPPGPQKQMKAGSLAYNSPRTPPPRSPQLEPDSSLQIKAIELPANEKSSWEALGARSALLIPLVTPAGSWVGLLTVTSPASGGAGAPHRARFCDDCGPKWRWCWTTFDW